MERITLIDEDMLINWNYYFYFVLQIRYLNIIFIYYKFDKYDVQKNKTFKEKINYKRNLKQISFDFKKLNLLDAKGA